MNLSSLELTKAWNCYNLYYSNPSALLVLLFYIKLLPAWLYSFLLISAASHICRRTNSHAIFRDVNILLASIKKNNNKEDQRMLNTLWLIFPAVSLLVRAHLLFLSYNLKDVVLEFFSFIPSYDFMFEAG